MSYQETCDIIFKLYLYADTAKMIHYSIDSMHGHELADEVRDTVIEFADELAEQYFGYYGKPRFSQLSIKHDVKIDEDINKLCQNCLDTVEIVRTECEKVPKLSGIVSLVDGFKEKMSKLVFLGTFDKVSNTKLG
jgi:DNA-binding ferritin-like protein